MSPEVSESRRPSTETNAIRAPSGDQVGREAVRRIKGRRCSPSGVISPQCVVSVSRCQPASFAAVGAHDVNGGSAEIAHGGDLLSVRRPGRVRVDELVVTTVRRAPTCPRRRSMLSTVWRRARDAILLHRVVSVAGRWTRALARLGNRRYPSNYGLRSRAATAAISERAWGAAGRVDPVLFQSAVDDPPVVDETLVRAYAD
jgi:hypothetical protein